MALSQAEAGQAQEPKRAAPIAGPAHWRGTGLRTQITVLTARSVRAQFADPRMILAALLEPLFMLVLFSQVFAGIANTPNYPAGVAYIDYLIPAIMVNTALQSGVQAGIGLIDDIRNGIITRFRALPIWPGSVLIARSLASTIRSAARLIAILMLAIAIFGFRPAGGLLGVLGATGIGLVVGWSLGWIFIALACWMRRAEPMQAITGIAMFPLMFASNAFVPMASLPPWLHLVAQLNPMTYGIEAARRLTLGQPAGTGAIAAVLIGTAVAAMAAPTATRGFRRPAA